MDEGEQAELEGALGHHFQQVNWLERALTHSSRLPELTAARLDLSGDGIREKLAEDARQQHASKTQDRSGKAQDNEKLEFLGDAVLGLVVSEYLVSTFPDWSEGQLSKSRAQLVNASSLHAAARRLNLGRYLRLGRGEEKTGGREKPAVLADAYEAIIAAIYLDAGLDAARAFVRHSLLHDITGEGAERLGYPDHKSWLQEILQARGMPAAEYRVVSETGPDHRKTFVVEVNVGGRPMASASGANKKEAEQAAARLALEQLPGRETLGDADNGRSRSRG